MSPVSKLLGVLSAVVATLPTLTLFADAQTLPWKTPAYRMAYSSSKTHLIIQGGLDLAPSPEYFQLDLSVNWTTTPAWTNLKPPEAEWSMAGLSGAALPDGRFISRGVKGPTGADTKAQVGIFKDLTNWIPLNDLPLRDLNLNYQGYAVVASPKGEIYFPGDGFMLRSADDTNAVAIPQLPSVIAAVWCSTPEGYGVLATTINQNKLNFQVLVGTSQWKPLSVQGSIPALEGHCLIKDKSDDGKVYLFGGGVGTNARNGQLYALNLKNGNITTLGKGTEERFFMACAATELSFFVWGGMTSKGGLASTIPLVFRLETETWSKENLIPWIPPPPPPPPPPPTSGNPDIPDPSGNGTGTTPSGGAGNNGNNNNNGNGGGKGNGGKGTNIGDNGNSSSDSEGSQLNIAAVAGGVGGGIALLALVALFIFVGRKRRKSSKYDDWDHTSKRSARDDYSRRGRQESRASDNEKDYNTRRSEPLSAMHGEKELSSKPLRKKRSSSSLRRESDRDYESREQTEPLRYTSSSDQELNPSRSKGQSSSSRYNGPGAVVSHHMLSERERELEESRQPSVNSISTNRTLQGSSEGGPGRQPYQSSSRMPGSQAPRTSAQQSPRQQSGSLIPGSPIASGSQYGGSQFGGSQQGGSQHGGSQHGGSQYGGSQFGGSQSGRSNSSSQRALLSSPSHLPTPHHPGRALSNEEQQRLLQSPSDRANRIPSLGQTHSLPLPGGPNKPRGGPRENIGRGLSLQNLRPTPQPYAPRDDDIPDHYRILLAPADSASSTTGSIIYSPSIASERTMELIPMGDHDTSNGYSSPGNGHDHLRSPPIRNTNSTREYPRSRLHIVDHPNHDDDAESYDGSMQYI